MALATEASWRCASCSGMFSTNSVLCMCVKCCFAV